MPTLFDTHIFTADAPGPRLIVLGAVHGNETCGTRAIERLLPQLQSGEVRIAAGQLTLIPVTNRLAYDNHRRTGDRNLNRNLSPTTDPQENEDRIANELCPLLAANDALLDLHSFHSPGAPFVMLGPDNNQGTLEPFGHAREEEALAVRLGVTRAVDGWLDTYAAGAGRRGGSAKYGMGTTEYMRTVGGYGLTLECGQHDDPTAPDVAYRAILNTLAHLRMIDAPAPQPQARMEMLRLVEVVDRADPGDSLARHWTSFDPVRRGEVIGRRASGQELLAPDDGFVVFPNDKAVPGAEWFFFAKRHNRLQ
ncbi:MAG TPA: succinylglutamate desuccinylase/aspartoacylase family protein [Ramlibacter sp.]|nr:succinylglutamate desuccinylase/aspartoacylase family protein [Ramlibacter sp.]